MNAIVSGVRRTKCCSCRVLEECEPVGHAEAPEGVPDDRLHLLGHLRIDLLGRATIEVEEDPADDIAQRCGEGSTVTLAGRRRPGHPGAARGRPLSPCHRGTLPF